jgi:hypothetical protein
MACEDIVAAGHRVCHLGHAALLIRHRDVGNFNILARLATLPRHKCAGFARPNRWTHSGGRKCLPRPSTNNS